MSDLIKMYLKLDEFFQQQFRIFSTLHSATSLRRKGPTKVAKSVVESGLEAQHHQHWQEVLRRVAGLQVATLPTPLPSTGTILGGTMELHGDHISLACFHGLISSTNPGPCSVSKIHASVLLWIRLKTKISTGVIELTPRYL